MYVSYISTPRESEEGPYAVVDEQSEIGVKFGPNVWELAASLFATFLDSQ